MRVVRRVRELVTDLMLAVTGLVLLAVLVMVVYVLHHGNPVPGRLLYPVMTVLVAAVIARFLFGLYRETLPQLLQLTIKVKEWIVYTMLDRIVKRWWRKKVRKLRGRQ